VCGRRISMTAMQVLATRRLVHMMPEAHAHA